MYLISLYFDPKTNRRIQEHINDVAGCSGNTYMLDKKIPPHITLTAFESKVREEELTGNLDKILTIQKKGELTWVSVGVFHTGVLFLMPVLNEYLHKLSLLVTDTLEQLPDTKAQKCYRPFSWLPHTTIGKRLTEEEMQGAFMPVQKTFTPFSGEVVKIGLSKTTPKEDLQSWKLS